MKKAGLLLMTALAAVTSTTWAQPQVSGEMTKTPGHAAVNRTVQIRATVEHIDPDTRTVILKTQHKKIIEVELGDEVRNFDQLKVGDVVTTTYRESLGLSLKKNGGDAASIEEKPTMERSPAGSKPGGSVGRQLTVVADVIAVHPQSSMVTLKGPKGNTVDLLVEDPKQFADIKKGDQVQATYTDALAISVEPAVKK